MNKYIKKSDIVAEIERRIEKCNIFYIVADNNNAKDAMEEIKREIQHYKSLLDFLNTLEVKEVDLEKEISNYLDNHNLNIQDGGRIVFNNGDTPNFLCDFRDIAKHFFELGLKSKGE